MSDEIYAKELLRWAADVSRAGSLPGDRKTGTANNAMCGDRVTMDFEVDPTHEICDCRHETKACVITQAATAILAANAVGETGESLGRVRDRVAAMLKDGADAPSGKWSVFSIFVPVRDHRSRHTCVLLPFEAAAKALDAS
ncbi:MAG: iron-sulfur cluster assembly scaffold protein [Alphaproteobacteria bacterium]